MAENILNEGRETLVHIRDEVIHQTEDVSKVSELSEDQEKNERALSIRKKQVKEEISSTIKTRRADVAATFDNEDAKLIKLIQDENDRRSRVRNGQVSDRISIETAALINENESLAAEAKKMYKDTKTPSFFNSTAFYTFFAPRGLGDFCLCLLLFALIYFAIPCGIYYFGIGAPRKPLYLVLIYLVCIIVFGGLYLLIHSKAIGRHHDTVEKGKGYRARIRNNRRQIRRISRRIERDRDDSSYDLAEFDKRIADLNNQRSELAEKKKSALALFDNETSKAITNEINERSQREIDQLSAISSKLNNDIAGLHAAIKQETLDITQKYEVFLGRDYVTPDSLNRMCVLMDNEACKTIGDALEAYKKEKQQNE